jgi:hypothetical protein
VWELIGPEHKTGKWMVAIQEDDPENKAIVFWDHTNSDTPWIGSAGDHDYRADAFTHAFPLPAFGE